MSPTRRSVLMVSLSLALGACATGNHQQLAELQAELRVERELLKDTRTEMQALIQKLEPMLAFSLLLQNNMGMLANIGNAGLGADDERPATEAPPSRHDAPRIVAEGITRVSGTETHISRSAADAILNDPTTLAAGARIVPSFKDGQAIGFKLYGIRPSSIYAKLGLMNGDTIHRINGFDLTTPDKALEVYVKIKDASALAIELTRGGQPVTIAISIQ